MKGSNKLFYYNTTNVFRFGEEAKRVALYCAAASKASSVSIGSGPSAASR